LSTQVAILFAGVDAGLRVAAADVVGALLAAAHAFLDEQTAQLDADLAKPERPAWRVRELVDGPGRVAVRTAAALGVILGAGRRVPGPGVRAPVGIIGQPGGLVALGAVVPLGRVSGVQMKVLEEAEAVVVTPWRGVVLPDLPPSAAESWQQALADVGLEVRGGSRWSGVTACAGRPGCAKSLADVRRDAAAAVLSSDGDEPSLPVHWVGCARGCGSPAGPHVRAEATGSGYAVRAGGFSGFASADEAGALVAAARRG
jgi:precorrin-3B synthase